MQITRFLPPLIYLDFSGLGIKPGSISGRCLGTGLTAALECRVKHGGSNSASPSELNPVHEGEQTANAPGQATITPGPATDGQIGSTLSFDTASRMGGCLDCLYLLPDCLI